jgi:hypothetical protein
MNERTRKKLLIAIFAVCLNLVLIQTALADPPPAAPSQAAAPAANNASVDITISDAGDLSVGGVSLRLLGLGQIDNQVVTVAKSLEDAHLVVQDEVITLDVQGTEVVKILWSPTSRQTVTALMAHYGMQIDPDVQARLEGWINTSNIDVTARFANEPSRPLSIDLTRLIVVDVAPNGQLAIEKIPLATGIDPTALQTIQKGGNQATACWNKGTLTAKVNGADLPSITLNPKGVNLVSKALNLPIDANAESAVLDARLGFDLSLPGGTHAGDGSCG